MDKHIISQNSIACSTVQTTVQNGTSLSLGLPSTLRYFLLAFLTLLLIVGIVGNLLTLVALPYVRKKYGDQFSVLKSTTFILLLHLAFCDLLYILVGFPHFIHVLIVDSNPFLQLGMCEDQAATACYTVALVRNLAASADFATMGAIALCICKHKICRQCRLAGGPSYHGAHNDPVFGNQGIYLVIIFIWIWSFAVNSCDIFGITGEYKWTNTMYGCDHNNLDSKHMNYVIPITIIGTLLVILVAYSIVIRRMVIDDREARTTMAVTNSTNKTYTRHIKIMFIIFIAYAVCVLPVSFIGWRIFESVIDVSNEIKILFSCLYWCMYGLNFVLYVTTSKRLRAAYWVFLKDMFRRRKVEDNCETDIWWSGLRYLSRSEEKRTENGSNMKTDLTVKSVSHICYSTYV